MKVLTTEELAWLYAKLAIYPIRYTEIYHEIADHIISAIEYARAGGDERDIELIYQEVMAFHFPSEKAISKIVIKHVYAFNRTITKQIWANFASYLSWPVILLIAILMAYSFYIPVNKLTSGVFMGLLLVLAATPQFYALFKLPKIRKIKVDPSKSAFEPGNLRKVSLRRDFVRSRSGALMFIALIETAIAPAIRKYHIAFLSPLHYYSAFNMALVVVYTIYGLSCMRLCRQNLRVLISD